MKIGILTYHKAHNYGACLQAYSLCSRLNAEKDITAEIIDFRMQKEADIYSLQNWDLLHKIVKLPQYRFEKEKNNMFLQLHQSDFLPVSQESLISDSIDDFQRFVSGKYDIIIAGSDEIWRTDGFRGFPTPYWLPGNLGCRKFAYAVSSRCMFSKDPALSKKIYDLISDFEFIGCRDEITREELQKLSAQQIFRCCDPSFLYDYPLSGYDMISKIPGIDKDKKTVLVMTESKSAAEQIRMHLHEKYNLISVFHWNKGYINVSGLKPLEWLSLLGQSDFVAASYFHAICFSMVLKTPFLAFGTSTKASKVQEILRDSGLSNRFISSLSDLSSYEIEMLFQNEFVWEPDEIRNIEQYVKIQRYEFERFIALLKNVK